MPQWGWHIALARDLIVPCNIQNEFEFLIGSVAPDTPWWTLDKAQASGARNVLHNAVPYPDKICTTCNIIDWVSQHTMDMSSMDLWKGMLTHLVLDSLVNEWWSCHHTRISIDRFTVCFNNKYQQLTHEEVAHSKWKLTDTYIKERFPDIAKYFEGARTQCITARAHACITHTLSVDDYTDNKAYQRVLKDLRAEPEYNTSVELDVVPIFDSIHEEALLKCKRILNDVPVFVTKF